MRMLVVGICGLAGRDGYNWLSKAGYKHEKVNHSKNQKVNAEGLGANPVEGLISRVFLVGCAGIHKDFEVVWQIKVANVFKCLARLPAFYSADGWSRYYYPLCFFMRVTLIPGPVLSPVSLGVPVGNPEPFAFRGPYGSFPKQGLPYFGVLMIRIPPFRVLY